MARQGKGIPVKQDIIHLIRAARQASKMKQGNIQIVFEAGQVVNVFLNENIGDPDTYEQLTTAFGPLTGVNFYGKLKLKYNGNELLARIEKSIKIS